MDPLCNEKKCGQLQAGEKIPSSRTLSEMMSISRNSVLSGLERLIDEGYLQTKAGSGTYVASIIPDEMIAIKSSSSADNKISKLNHTNINPHRHVVKEIWDKTQPYSGQQMIFNIGVGCTDLFPYELWGRLSGRVWRQFRHQDRELNHPMGYPPLRRAISEYVRATRGLFHLAGH